MTKVEIFVIGVVILGIILLYLNSPKRRLERALDKCMEDFIVNYSKVQELMDKQFESTEIIEFLGADTNEYNALTFNFGNLKSFECANTKELRQCFILCGEYIIKYVQILEERYSITINTDTDENFLLVLQILKDIRTNALRLNEKTNLLLL